MLYNFIRQTYTYCEKTLYGIINSIATYETLNNVLIICTATNN